MTAHIKGLLPLQHLSTQAKMAHVFNDLKSAFLISLGRLCDDGCKIVLTKTHLEAWKDKRLVLQGLRNNNDGLWDIPLPQNSNSFSNFQTHMKFSESPHTCKQILNVVINKKSTISNLMKFLHACCRKSCNVYTH